MAAMGGGMGRGTGMFIDIHELELHPIDFDEKLRPEELDLGPEGRLAVPLNASGRAELLTEHDGGRGKLIQDIRLRGQLKTTLDLVCARCLEPVKRDLDRTFDLLYRPQGVDAGKEEISITQVEAEIGYYTDEGLELTDVLREQVLLAVPLKTLCRDDCKGLCPQCGKNLNTEACSCKPDIDDPRWDALKHIKI